MDFEYAMLPQMNLSPQQQETLMDAFLESDPIAGFHSGRIIDISGGGIRFISDHPMDENSFLRLRLHLEFDYGNEDLCETQVKILEDFSKENKWFRIFLLEYYTSLYKLINKKL